MSMDKNYYVIAGYDLTQYKTDKFREWIYEEGEEYICHPTCGRVQLFDDLDRNRYLYLGYIFAAGDEYDFQPQKIDLVEAEMMELKVSNVLEHLQEVGVVTEDIDIRGLVYELIAFEECT